MARGPRFHVGYRRKREGKTDYRKRVRLLISEKPRLVVRRSSRHILLQIIEYSQVGDKVMVSSHSNELKRYGWKGSTSNLTAAYLTGFLCGREAKKKGIKEAVLDIGLVAPIGGSRVFAALKGAIDAGLKVPHGEEVLPDNNRIRGEHIASYAEALKKEKQKRFSKYLERGLDPLELPKHFDEVLGKIKGG